MSGENEDVLVESQSLDADKQKKKDILSVIESHNSFQEAIEKLEKEKLIWYLIGPLRKDEEVRKQINSKWEADFQKFEQLIDARHKELESSLPNQNFLAYSTKDNDFNISFESKEEPVKISDILRASSEGEVYHISLGGDNQITASKKNGNERHYDFAGPGSCEMTINWQAKDSEGNSIDSSMTIEVGSDGILEVIGEPKFGEITDSEEVLKLVKQNKEVFINGKTLYQAFVDMGKGMSNQPTQEEETFIRNPPASPQSHEQDSAYFPSVSTSTSFSRRSSLSLDEEEYEQEEKELENKVKELEKENEYLRKENAELKILNAKITREGDNEISRLGEEKQALEGKVKELRTKLEKSEKELDGKNQGIGQLNQKIGELEQKLKDKGSEIADLKSQLEDEKNKVQSIDKINEALQEKLGQSEAELRTLQEKNAKLKSDLEKIEKNLKDNYEKRLEKLSSEKEKELANARNRLDEEQLQNKELAEELKKLQKEKENLEEAIQQPSGKSLADELNEENMQSKIDRLKRQLEERESMIADV
ncbi:MAG: hypothetical protein LBC34_00385 [Rickettsiales bacterium]|jgi:DNA repair exonuclease SbcCD ATPase subunit|nr:hypothetical protein [Rickettsiales bacterium]